MVVRFVDDVDSDYSWDFEVDLPFGKDSRTETYSTLSEIVKRCNDARVNEDYAMDWCWYFVDECTRRHIKVDIVSPQLLFKVR